MTLTPAQEQALWKFVREFARYWRASGSLEDQAAMAAARALLEVSEPPKEYDEGELMKTRDPELLLSAALRDLDPLPQVGRAEMFISMALRIYREEQDTHKRTLEAMGAKNDRLEERIERAIKTLHVVHNPDHPMSPTCNICEARRILRGEDK